VGALALFDAPAARDVAAVDAPFAVAFTGRGGLNWGPFRAVPFALAFLGGMLDSTSGLS
jgi:hypothetical protein